MAPLLIMVGSAIVTIATNLAARLLIAFGYLLEVKSTKEEEFLVEGFQRAYQRLVPQTFFPSALMKQLPWKK
eukprot:scaffold5966_cov118-Cylindrotheca_fusiformis.AAC.27